MFLVPLIVAASVESSNLNELKFEIKGLRNSEGNILYLLFNHAQGFPDDDQKSLRKGYIKASEAQNLGLTFSDLPSGEYALSIFHDENQNNKLDTNFLGIPIEGFGFSNNPKILFGPPSFEKSRFRLDQSKILAIELKYF